MTTSEQQLSRTFLWICLAQVVSLIGTQLTGFGLGLSVFQDTGSSTRYALLLFALVTPEILLAPAAGVLVDRYDRRSILMISHGGAGLCSLVLISLWSAGALSFPVAFTVIACGSAFASLQFPAVSALTSQLVAKDQLGRASGLVQLGFAAARLVAPVVGGSILLHASLTPILAIDVATFSFALVVLSCLRTPRQDLKTASTARWQTEILEGWRFVRQRRGLMWLLLFGATMSVCFGMVEATITPLVLGFADSQQLGTVLSIGGIGMVVGSVFMVAWGGPRRKIVGVLVFSAIQASCLLLAVFKPSLWLVAIGMFGAMGAMAISISCAQAIWQARVPHALLGRVTAFRALVGGGALPLGFVTGGWLAEHVFEPLLQRDGALATVFGGSLGTGPGRGVALMFLLLAAVSLLTVAAAWSSPTLRDVDSDESDAEPYEHAVVVERA